MLALLALFVPDAVAANGCAVAELESQLEAAGAAYAEMDQAGFDDAMDRAALTLGCVETPISPETAAALQRLQGLRLLALDQETTAQGAFAAARRIGPDPAFEATLGERSKAAYAALDPKNRDTEDVAPPESGDLLFDGTPDTERPAGWPVLVQHVEDDGSVAFTRYLLPGAPLPAYAAVAPPRAVVARCSPPQDSARSQSACSPARRRRTSGTRTPRPDSAWASSTPSRRRTARCSGAG